MKRKLRMGMIGGGKGAFIGAVHRLAANMDGLIELGAGDRTGVTIDRSGAVDHVLKSLNTNVNEFGETAKVSRVGHGGILGVGG